MSTARDIQVGDEVTFTITVDTARIYSIHEAWPGTILLSDEEGEEWALASDHSVEIAPPRKRCALAAWRLDQVVRQGAQHHRCECGATICSLLVKHPEFQIDIDHDDGEHYVAVVCNRTGTEL